MDYKEKEAALLSLLYRERNGAVVGSMREKGMEYETSYGVSLPDIRAIAERFATDHGFAKYIYPGELRELRLAAFFIADPAQLVSGEIPFWQSGITTTEIAANGALRLFSKSPAAPQLIFGLFATGTPLLKYAALMSAAANLTHTKGNPAWEWESLADAIRRDKSADPAAYGGALGEALEALTMRLVHFIPSCAEAVEDLGV